MFRFNLSVSTKPYDRNKDEKRTGSLEWQETETTVDGLKDFVLHNYAFCNCFYHNTPTFTNSQKTDKNLKGANMIILDMDAVRYNIDDFWSCMTQTEICPTFVYTSRNDGHIKKPTDKYPHRYRVVYVMDDAIRDSNQYSVLVNKIEDEIEEYCEGMGVRNDNTDVNCSHFFAGNPNATWYMGDVFPLSFFIDRYDLKVSCTPYIYSKKKGRSDMYAVQDTFEKPQFNDESFSNDWSDNTPDIKMIYDYRDYYTYTTTPIDWEDGELDRYVEDTHIYTLKRKWTRKEDPITHIEYNTIVRYKYGEHRKKKIWTALLIRRLIKPSITLEELCYAAIYELYNYVDNTDKEHFITRKQLLHIAQEVFGLDLTKYRDTYRWKTESGNPKVYLINKMERIKRGIVTKSDIAKLVGVLNKKYKVHKKNKGNMEKMKKAENEYTELAKRYDQTMSVRKNAELLGIAKTKAQSLKKWMEKASGEPQTAQVEQLPTEHKTTQPDAQECPKTDYNFKEWCEKMNKLQNETTGDDDIETLTNKLKQIDMMMVEAKNNIKPTQYSRCCSDIIAFCNLNNWNMDFDKICLVSDFKRKYAKKTQW